MNAVVGIVIIGISFCLGMLAEAQLHTREAYNAGMQAQADNVCMQIARLPHGVLGVDGRLVACDGVRATTD